MNEATEEKLSGSKIQKNKKRTALRIELWNRMRIRETVENREWRTEVEENVFK